MSKTGIDIFSGSPGEKPGLICHRDKAPCSKSACPMWIEEEDGEPGSCAEADEVLQRARFFGELADVTELLQKKVPEFLPRLLPLIQDSLKETTIPES